MHTCTVYILYVYIVLFVFGCDINYISMLIKLHFFADAAWGKIDAMSEKWEFLWNDSVMKYARKILVVFFLNSCWIFLIVLNELEFKEIFFHLLAFTS